MKNSFITEKGSMYFTKTKYGKTMKEKTRSHERSPITDHVFYWTDQTVVLNA